MVPESKSGDCFGCCSLLFPAPVRLLSTLEAIKEGINSTFVLVEQIQRYSCVKTFCFHIARIYGCTQCCCTSCRDCFKKGPRMGWFKPQFVSSDRGTCLAWLAARIRGMSDFRELSLVSTHSHPPQGSSTHPFLLVPLPSQRKGVKARMVKGGCRVAKTQQGCIWWVCGVGQRLDRKMAPLSHLCTQQSQDQRNYLLLSSEVIHFPTSG